MRLLKDTPYVEFPSGGRMHRLDPDKPGQTLCGRDVDPWTAYFYSPSGPGVCARCRREMAKRWMK